MTFHFFLVPLAGGAGAAELNQFLASHRVLAVDRELVHDGANSAWAFCVSVTPSCGPSQAGGGAKGSVDYKATLPPEQFEIFARLHALRKSLAERDGVPPYTVFNNEQLDERVRRGVRSASGLAAIPGVGPARLEKYGPEFLAVLGGEPAEVG